MSDTTRDTSHPNGRGNSKSKWVMQTITLLLLGIVLVFVVRFIAAVDFVALGDLLKRTPVMLPAVILMSLISYASSNYAWKLCLEAGGEKSPPFWRLFMVRLIGDMLVPFNPAGIVAGETVKVVLLRRDGVSVEHALSSVLTHRGLVMLTNVLLLIVAVLYILLRSAIRTQRLLVAVALVAAMALICYFLLRLLIHPRLLIGRMAERLARRTGWSYLSEERIAKIYNANQEASEFYHHHRRRFLLVLMLLLVHWVFGAMEFFVIFMVLGVPISVISAVAIEMGVGLFKAAGTLVPGQLGVEEYGNKVMLDLFGIESNEIWLTASLMRRGRQLFWLVIAGVGFLVMMRGHRRSKSKDVEECVDRR